MSCLIRVNSKEQELSYIRPSKKGIFSIYGGRTFTFLKEHPKLCAGITITACFLMILSGILLTPGGLGLIGHFISHPILALVNRYLNFATSITLLSLGGLSLMASLACIIFLLVKCLMEICTNDYHLKRAINRKPEVNIPRFDHQRLDYNWG